VSGLFFSLSSVTPAQHAELPPVIPSSRALAVLATSALMAVGAVALWKLSSDTGAPPSPADNRAWTWISSVPGANVYVHEALPAAAPERPRVWFDFKSSRGPVSVDADLVELWEFDCPSRSGRRAVGPLRFPDSKLEGHPSPDRAWRTVAPETVLGRMMAQVCPVSIPRHPER
jgi:hypothetical protein